MTPTITYNAIVNDDGVLHIIHRAKFDDDIARLFKGKDITITIERKHKKRSGNQNRYYWGAVIPIVKQGLYDAGIILSSIETHELLKENCNKTEIVNERTGVVIERSGSTAALTPSEFMDYMTRVKYFCLEFLNVTIPEPQEQLSFI